MHQVLLHNESLPIQVGVAGLLTITGWLPHSSPVENHDQAEHTPTRGSATQLHPHDVHSAPRDGPVQSKLPADVRLAEQAIPADGSVIHHLEPNELPANVALWAESFRERIPPVSRSQVVSINAQALWTAMDAIESGRLDVPIELAVTPSRTLVVNNQSTQRKPSGGLFLRGAVAGDEFSHVVAHVRPAGTVEITINGPNTGAIFIREGPYPPYHLLWEVDPQHLQEPTPID